MECRWPGFGSCVHVRTLRSPSNARIEMKNQYFGDVNDYHKYGLLRVLQSSGRGSLLVAWMLTPDDGSSDGRDRAYLEQPAKWRPCDPELFDGLSSLLGSAARPCVSTIERSSLLPGAAFFSTVVPEARPEREAWRERLLHAAAGADLVFVDPDVGIEVRGKHAGRRHSSKYVMWVEIEGLWQAGSSVLVYQHFPREARKPFAERVAGELRARTGARFVEGLRTPRVLFLLAAQTRHEQVFREAIATLSDRWCGRIAAMGLTDELLLPSACVPLGGVMPEV